MKNLMKTVLEIKIYSKYNKLNIIYKKVEISNLIKIICYLKQRNIKF